MESVADLVDAQFLRLSESTIGAECFLFEEAVDTRSRRHELLVGMAFLFVGGEHAAIGVRVERLEDVLGSGLHSCTDVTAHEVGDHQEAVVLVTLDLIVGEHASHV